MKRIADDIRNYITKWWQEVDKQMLFWVVSTGIVVIWSIFCNM
jgi:hypothetical protein